MTYRKLFIFVVAIISVMFGCVATQIEPAPEGSKEFQKGYTDGCKTGLLCSGDIHKKWTRDKKRYATDEEYKRGWEEGFFKCIGEVEITEKTEQVLNILKLEDKIKETTIASVIQLPPHTVIAKSIFTDKHNWVYRWPMKMGAIDRVKTRCGPFCALVFLDGDIVWEKELSEWEQKYIKDKKNFDKKLDKHGNKILHSVTYYGHLEYIKALIENGADVNIGNKYKATPLMIAAEKGNIDVAKLLIDNGADIMLANMHGSNALMFAADKGQQDMVKFLIEYGADVDSKTKNGFTALMVASQGGRTGIAKLLVESGADINSVNTGGYTALKLAKTKGHEDIVKFLKEKGAQ